MNLQKHIILANSKDRFDKIVTKLQRRYGKEELILNLNRKLSEAEVEIGKLKSYIDELEHNREAIELELVSEYSQKLKKMKEELTQFYGNQLNQEMQKESLYNKLLSKNKQLKYDNSRKTQTISDLVTKLHKYEHPNTQD